MKPAVLVVDDSRFFREAIVSALKQIGSVDAITARNGQEALDILASTAAIKAVVLDASMPILDGPATLRRLGAERTAALSVVVTGTAAQRAALDECKGLGACVVLEKPLAVDALGRLLYERAARAAMQESAAP